VRCASAGVSVVISAIAGPQQHAAYISAQRRANPRWVGAAVRIHASVRRQCARMVCSVGLARSSSLEARRRLASGGFVSAAAVVCGP